MRNHLMRTWMFFGAPFWLMGYLYELLIYQPFMNGREDCFEMIEELFGEEEE